MLTRLLIVSAFSLFWAAQVSMQTEEVVFDLLHETAFHGSGLGRTILGPEANIRSLTRQQLKAYISTHYTGPRIVVAAAGAVDHGALVGLADAAFGALPSTGAPSRTGPAPFVGSLITHRDDDLGLAHVAVGFETGGWTNAHAFPLMIMQVCHLSC
jgi:mitochondrial-processing peptidase subunit beta